MFFIFIFSASAQTRPSEFKKYKSVHEWTFVNDLTKDQISKIEQIETGENAKVAELWSRMLNEESTLNKMKTDGGIAQTEIELQQKKVNELYKQIDRERAAADKAILRELNDKQQEQYKQFIQ